MQPNCDNRRNKQWQQRKMTLFYHQVNEAQAGSLSLFLSGGFAMPALMKADLCGEPKEIFKDDLLEVASRQPLGSRAP